MSLVANELKKICEKHKIGLVYSFGSQHNEVRDLFAYNRRISEKDSMADADIGVVFEFSLHGEVLNHKLYAAVFNDLEDLFLPLPLDLILLQQCHSVMQFEAIKGHCLYQISECFRDDFEMSVLRRVPDFRRMLQNYNQEKLEMYY